MDAKSIREQRKAMATARAGGSTGKVDSSNFTPAEPLNADVKTGMRPISKRAFKKGGAVTGDDVQHNAGRRSRKSTVSEKVGLANTDQKEANEDRDGKKHVGGFASGGTTKGGYSKTSVDKEIAKDKSIGKKEGKMINALLKGRQKEDEPEQPYKKGGTVKKASGGALEAEPVTQESMDSSARSNESASDERSLAPKTSPRPMPKPKFKKGGKVGDDECCDDGDKDDGKKGDRVERKRGGKVGKTNINIIIGAGGDKQHPAPMPVPPPAPPAPHMGSAPPPAHMGLPPGLGQALAGAAGVQPPMGGPAGGGMPQMMARKSGGRVYPIDTGAGGAQARLDKIKAYGLKPPKK